MLRLSNIIVIFSVLLFVQGQHVYEALSLTSELNINWNSNNSQYSMFEFDPNYFDQNMILAFYDFQNKEFFFPDSSLQALGCDRKVHVTEWGYLYCVDQQTNYLYQISPDMPFEVINKWWLGFSEDASYYDWSDLATQYLIFCDITASPNDYEQVNFTIFNMETQTWIASYEFQPGEIAGNENYVIEGYFITPEFQGWALEPENPSDDLNVQYWKYNFETKTYSKFAEGTYPVVQRTITMNYTTVIEIYDKTIFTVNVENGVITQNEMPDPLLFIEKINDTYFSATYGTTVNLFTTTPNSTLVHAAQYDANYFLTSLNYTFTAPICCPQNGYLQTFIQQQFQNSYLVLNSDTLAFEDYVVSYPIGISGGVYFPPFALGNGNIVSPDLGGYRISTKDNKFVSYTNLPLQDVYIDYSDHHMVYGFYSGSSLVYTNTNCYLLAINVTVNSFNIINLGSCPNPNKENVNLVDVQATSNGYNIVYQTNSGFVVIENGKVYNVVSLVAMYGTSTVYPNYTNNNIYVLSQVKTGQLVLENFQITSGAKLSTQVIALLGIAQKVSPRHVIYASKSLTGNSTVYVMDIQTQSPSYSNPVPFAISSISPVSVDLAGSRLVTQYVYVDTSSNIWGVDVTLGETTQIDYNNYGNIFVAGVGRGNFVLTTYNQALQETHIYRLDDFML